MYMQYIIALVKSVQDIPGPFESVCAPALTRKYNVHHSCLCCLQ